MKNLKKSLLIQSDFDNTITVGNVSEQIHAEFGPSNWPQIYKKYKKKLITVEESNIYSFKNLNVRKSVLDDFVKANVKFRAGFLDFINYINIQKIDFKIVSSGVDFYIKSALSSLNLDGLETISGKSHFTDIGMEISYFDINNELIVNNFKYSYTKHHKTKYDNIIYFGDSGTDINASKISDVVFATDKLSDYYKNNKLPYYKFDNFFEVLKVIKNDNLTKSIIP